MKIFQESPNYFFQFLKSDLDFLSDVLGYRTSVRLEQVHVIKSRDFLQERIVSMLQSINLEQLLNDEIPYHLKNYNSNAESVVLW